MDKLPYSPKQFLKMRRPDRFSDTVAQDVPVLDRSLLEFHLETLTNRSEELLFEDFARALLERTVCPNLLPHTGPTGGGDSKVDSETFPVADALAMGWYIGEPGAASERWAFAFSAKKDWRPKAESDIAKLVTTGRGYKKAFFVSNQYIRDKERAEVEDALRKKHAIDVRIFDRTWILDQVFGRGLCALAVERLHMQTSLRREVSRGPNDTARQQEFDAVEGEIAKALQENRRTGALVDKCLLAAELARGMERPREEVEGLYERAGRMARDYGSSHQQLLCDYERAWTTYWWYEDYKSFVELYPKVEERAKDSRNAYELELWSNLLFCLRVAAQQANLASLVDVEARASILAESLSRLAKEEERPSASLHARTLLLHQKLLLALPDQREELLRELTDAVHAAEGLVGYPFEPLAEIVTEMGVVFGELPAYQKLFEVVVEASSKRAGDVVAARLLLSAGAQELDRRHPYEAIRKLGRAIGRLFKHETRDDVVRALCLCSYAYEHVGLLWAARGTALAAASIATNDVWTYEEVTPLQAACYNRVKWVELRLGRLAHALAWYDLDRIVRAVLLDAGYRSPWLTKDDLFDPILGILLLKADIWELKSLAQLPEVLESLELPLAAVALRYALGHEDEVPPELIGGDLGADERRNFFRQWRDQPAAADLPAMPWLGIERTVEFLSSIAGSKISLTCDNSSPSLELAESLLACLEAFLATAVADGVVGREPIITIRVRSSDFAEAPFEWQASDVDGRPHVELRCRTFSPHTLTMEEQAALKTRLLEVVAHIFARAFAMKDAEALLRRLFQEDLAPQRALDFATSFVVVGNVLGHEPKTSLDRWTKEAKTEVRLIRDQAWDAEDRRAVIDTPKVDLKPAPADQQVPSEMQDISRLTHGQLRTVSLIRESLWNRAGWNGTYFITWSDPAEPPILALLFRNPDEAIRIFAAWHEELGANDERNLLRVAIIRRISRKQPHWYRVVLGTEPASCLNGGDTSHVIMMSRFRTMEPDSSDNLDRFLKAFGLAGEYILGCATFVNDELAVASYKLRRRQLVVRDAWEIGPNDPESVAIDTDDDPVIPEGVENPPVFETIKRNSQLR